MSGAEVPTQREAAYLELRRAKGHLLAITAQVELEKLSTSFEVPYAAPEELKSAQQEYDDATISFENLVSFNES